jgi:hypothetical protein
MDTSFKFSIKLSKYIQVDYITGLDYIPIGYHKYAWFLDKKRARDFIQRFREIETHVKEIINGKKLSFDYRLIMCKFLKSIDSISGGFDVRSDISSIELADRFVSSYENSYKESFTFCKDTLEHVEVEGKFDSYMKDWVRYDKHNGLVREYNLPFKSLNLEDFQVDHLKSALESVDAMLKILNERNK